MCFTVKSFHRHFSSSFHRHFIDIFISCKHKEFVIDILTCKDKEIFSSIPTPPPGSVLGLRLLMLGIAQEAIQLEPVSSTAEHLNWCNGSTFSEFSSRFHRHSENYKRPRETSMESFWSLPSKVAHLTL